ncbi:hypothetical protein FRC19_011779 [Serendipita sp. 401]|nr:hypothetical protein FRC19_011779 [Serendipita sp. 401]KAG9043164.1 hypothetical protein FS842_001911 [Serendipita sp. 407]
MSTYDSLEIARHLPNLEDIGLFHGLYRYYEEEDGKEDEEEDEDWENRSILVSQRHSPIDFAHSAQDHLKCYLAHPISDAYIFLTSSILCSDTILQNAELVY